MSTVVNGQIYDHGDVEVTFILANGAMKVLRMESIDYEAPLENQAKYGHQRRPIGRTKGRVDPKWNGKMLKEDADELSQFLLTGNGSLYGGSFGISVRYGTGTQPKQVDQLKECQLTNMKSSSSDGVDSIPVELSGQMNDLIQNGVPLFPAAS